MNIPNTNHSCSSITSSIVIDLSKFNTWEDAVNELKSLIDYKRSFWGTTSLVLRFADFNFSEDEAYDLRALVEQARLVIAQIQTNSVRSWKFLRDKGFQTVSVPHTKIHNITGTGVRITREKIIIENEVENLSSTEDKKINKKDNKFIPISFSNNLSNNSSNLLSRNQLPSNSIESKTLFIGMDSSSPLRAGHSVFYDGNIVVLGDVNPGCQIKAVGSIIVYGKLSGSVHAGINCIDEQLLQMVCVKALKMVDPLQISIGNLSACSSGEMNSNQRIYPETAKIIDGRIWRISDFE